MTSLLRPVLTALCAVLGTLCPTAATLADALQVSAVEFTETPAPSSDLEMTNPYTRSAAVVTLADGTRQSFPLRYVPLARSGDYLEGGYAGLIVDKAGKPLLQSAADKRGDRAIGPFRAAGADGTSLLMVSGAKVPGVKGNPLFLVHHLEYATQGQNGDPAKPPVSLYGLLPMAMNLLTLDQDPVTGQLTPRGLRNVDFSATDGLWIPCNGSTTPWMTHLGSEEYEPDAWLYEDKPLEAMNLYLGTPGKTAAEGGAKPYMYGHIVEVAVNADGTTHATKHYAMGRLAFELGDVMGDAKTVYFGDDGDDVIRAMYVADRPGDLSAGTLYAAKWLQAPHGGPFGKAALQWIRLGHASNAQIKELIDSGIKFSDIWDVSDTAREGFTPLYTYGGNGSEEKLRYYKLKEDKQTAAAFLETRRYAAYRGATTEFTKMEGQAHSVADKKLWTAISYIRTGMKANPPCDAHNGEVSDSACRPRDDIHLSADDAHLACGAVYESQLAGGQNDAAGNPIDSDWVATDMVAVIHGQRQSDAATGGRFDRCDTNKVANPDNLRYSQAMRTLFVGEDSGNHLNNFVWAYNVDTATTVRIFSAPAGAENTGLNVYDDYNGHAYITTNIQHPGAQKDLDDYPDVIKHELRRMIDPRGWVGYFAGLPAMTR
jgi:secreted PhoX family phosphatase